MKNRNRQITLLYEMKTLKYLIEKWPKEARQLLNAHEKKEIVKSPGYHCTLLNSVEKVGG